MRSIIRLVSWAFPSPSGNCFNRSNSSCSFQSFLPPLLEFPMAGIRFEVLMLPRINGTSAIGFHSNEFLLNRFLQHIACHICQENPGSRLELARHQMCAYPKVIIFCLLQIINDFRIRTNHVCNIQRRQTHFRSNIARYGLKACRSRFSPNHSFIFR